MGFVYSHLFQCYHEQFGYMCPCGLCDWEVTLFDTALCC